MAGDDSKLPFKYSLKIVLLKEHSKEGQFFIEYGKATLNAIPCTYA